MFLKTASQQGLDSNNLLKRVTHIITEISRTTESIDLLSENDLPGFGQSMNQSGQSALDNYDLDDDTPELRYLFNSMKQMPNVLGVRNMGGGFSAVVLALLKNSEIDSFKKTTKDNYMNKYNSELKYIVFTPSAGTSVL